MKNTVTGRIGPCEKCAYPDCEYVIGSFQNCPRCAGKIKHTYELPDSSWDKEPDTDPGISYGGLTFRVGQTYNFPLPPPTITLDWGDYDCVGCGRMHYLKINNVANGQRCPVCNGILVISPGSSGVP